MRRPVISKRGTTSSTSPLPATPAIVHRPDVLDNERLGELLEHGGADLHGRGPYRCRTGLSHGRRPA